MQIEKQLLDHEGFKCMSVWKFDISHIMCVCVCVTLWPLLTHTIYLYNNSVNVDKGGDSFTSIEQNMLTLTHSV